MASRGTALVSNSGEDFVDELSSSIVYKYTNQIFKPTIKRLNESDDLVDQALASAITTLQFGIMQMVIISVTEYAITKATFAGGAIYIFLKSTNIARKTKEIMAGALGSIPFVGRGMGNVARATGSFVSKDRELISKMAMDTNNNLTTVISKERHNQILMKQSKYRKVDNTMDNAIKLRGDGRSKDMGYFTLKFKTGTWSKTAYNKKLYENCTGQRFGENGLIWNSDFVTKLNSYKEFALTSESKIVSSAQATIDLINSLGAKAL